MMTYQKGDRVFRHTVPGVFRIMEIRRDGLYELSDGDIVDAEALYTPDECEWCRAFFRDDYIVIDAGRLFGEPTIGHSRIDARMIAGAWWNGLAVGDMDWGITRVGVIVACWYQARYGTATWRRRWEGWLKEHEQVIWRGNYDAVPLPPQKGETQ